MIGKQERQSAGSAKSGVDLRADGHDSGYSAGSSNRPIEPVATNTTRIGAHMRSSSIGKSTGAMVYGIVQYDFNAERPDELDAKAGEAIIVIAQSNPEWFVAKPIGRLGGPGLIPVSFIELRDMTTGQAVEDPLAAVQRAGVPKVEEWKKMAAEYKNSSISLGKFDTTSQQAMASGMERMSLNGPGQQTPNQSSSAIVRLDISDILDITDIKQTGPTNTRQSTSTRYRSVNKSISEGIADKSPCTDICFDPAILLRQ